jgi:hypothetical protein
MIISIIIVGIIAGYAIALTSSELTLSTLAGISIAITSSVFALFPFILLPSLFSELKYNRRDDDYTKRLVKVSFLISILSILELIYLWLAIYLIDVTGNISKSYAGAGFSLFLMDILMFLYALLLFWEIVNNKLKLNP